MITSDKIRNIKGELDAQTIYHEVRSLGDFAAFAKQYIYDADDHVARNALWCLTKANDAELAQLQPMLNELIDNAMSTPHSAVRRLTLNIIERLKMSEEELRTDFLDFCLDHMTCPTELPGIQSLCMKLAYRMCSFYPELMGEFMRTIEAMEMDFYKPAVKSIRNRLLRQEKK